MIGVQGYSTAVCGNGSRAHVYRYGPGEGWRCATCSRPWSDYPAPFDAHVESALALAQGGGE